MLPAAFSVLTDRRDVNAEKAEGNIFVHRPATSINKRFIAINKRLLINPDNFIEKIDPAQQNSPAESTYEFESILLIHG